MRENDLPTIARAAPSAMRMVGALVLPEVMVGIAEASAGKHPCWIGAYPSRAAAGRVFSHDGNFTAGHAARRAVQEHDCAVVAKDRYRNRDLALVSSDIRESRSFDRPLTPIGVPGADMTTAIAAHDPVDKDAADGHDDLLLAVAKVNANGCPRDTVRVEAKPRPSETLSAPSRSSVQPAKETSRSSGFACW
ncbi:hypothetical protein [Mycobacterium intracellulare]|uniref:hypothetical protein n=1 Tax=Mycobacterium intracellulare TaxID=1767 RepID=UPI0018C8B85F|nr:hypothetical protein [Mycobacterium intracellulare]